MLTVGLLTCSHSNGAAFNERLGPIVMLASLLHLIFNFIMPHLGLNGAPRLFARKSSCIVSTYSVQILFRVRILVLPLPFLSLIGGFSQS